MQRWGIYFDEGLQEFYLDVSVHNRGMLLSDERKAQYDDAVRKYKIWQNFLARKYQGLPARKPKRSAASITTSSLSATSAVNVLDAQQAEAMIRYLVQGIPPAGTHELTIDKLTSADEWSGSGSERE